MRRPLLLGPLAVALALLLALLLLLASPHVAVAEGTAFKLGKPTHYSMKSTKPPAATGKCVAEGTCKQENNKKKKKMKKTKKKQTTTTTTASSEK